MRRTTRLWLGFSALCLLSGSQWMLDWIANGPMPGDVRKGTVHYGAVAIVFGVLAWVRRERVAGFVRIGLFGGLMFGLLEVSLQAGSAGSTGPVLLMLVPVVVIFVAAQSVNEFGGLDNPLRLIFPALVAVGGATLLLPLAVPTSLTGRLGLAGIVLCVLGAGFAAVRLHGLLQGAPVLGAGALIFGVSSVLEGVYGYRTGLRFSELWRPWQAVGKEALQGIAIDGPLLWLMIFLLREMRPVSFSSRYLAIPLVMFLTSYLVMRPSVDWTQGAGLALMAGGTIWLIRADSHEMLPTDEI